MCVAHTVYHSLHVLSTRDYNVFCTCMFIHDIYTHCIHVHVHIPKYKQVQNLYNTAYVYMYYTCVHVHVGDYTFTAVGSLMGSLMGSSVEATSDVL